MGALWTQHERDKVRVLLFGWPTWAADPERLHEVHDTMPTVAPDVALEARRLVREWESSGIPADRALMYIPAAVSVFEAEHFEADPGIDTTSLAFRQKMELLTALRR